MGRYAKQTPADSREVLRLICAIKPLASWSFIETAQISRERCGGAGYLAVNQMCGGIADGHAAVTAEGDNVVLAQKVAREVLQAFKEKSAKAGMAFFSLGLQIFFFVFTLRKVKFN